MNKEAKIKENGGLEAQAEPNTECVGTLNKIFVEQNPKGENRETDSLPGCVTFYGKPISPNGPCKTCWIKHVCKAVFEGNKKC